MPPSNQEPQARLFTPLEDGVFLLKSIEAVEQLSHPFKFTLSLYVLNKNKSQVQFDKLLGKDFTVECDVYSREKEKRTDENRYFSGICFEFHEGLQDAEFTAYTAEIVPKVQLLTLQAQSRIFQQKNVPDILKEVLPKTGVEFQLSGHYDKREYCAQHRETDFDFASRLMEEEGIFYFFKHAKNSHTMVIADSSLKHPKIQAPDSVDLDPTEAGNQRAAHIVSWKKAQQMKTGKYTLRDHHFQLPNSNLEAAKSIQDSAAVGKVDHKLKVGGNEELEIYDYPGGYARRFDGISKSSGDQSQELQTVNSDNQRTVKLRMEAEAAAAMQIHGESNCVNFGSGHKFSVEESGASKDFKGDGDYVFTEVHHKMELAVGHRTGEKGQFTYENKFSCLPFQIPYRPQRKTKKPTVKGMQSATVVGPAGEEIFTDKYGRVKVQFRWDREGKNDANSSCWLRVVTPWAGKQWGMIHIPRIGQEVIVDFLEGDPDAPIVIGSVYNPNTMPPYALPDNKTQSGIKTRSSKGGSPDNFNEIRFEDKKGSEELYIHAEKDQNIVVEHDQTTTVDNDDTEEVKNKQSITIGASQEEKIGTTRTTTVTQNDSLTVTTGDHTRTIQVGKSVTQAMQSIELIVGGNSIKIDQTGITLTGIIIRIN